MFTYEMKGLDELRQKFDPQLVNKAFEQAMQVAATKLRTRISKEIRVHYSVKAGDISKAVTLKRLPQLRMLVYTGRVIGLDKFGAKTKSVSGKRGRRTGATVLVRKTSGRKLVNRGFIADINGPKVFKRILGTKMQSNPKKEQIRRLYGPSVAHMAGDAVVENLALAQVGQDAATEFDRYLTFLMDKN
ncbi:MAG: hypothetical protein SH820_07685 [Xanthomonadales bacterium]|nr:hypothetical protein [Xanthomonadales bacterium]